MYIKNSFCFTDKISSFITFSSCILSIHSRLIHFISQCYDINLKGNSFSTKNKKKTITDSQSGTSFLPFFSICHFCVSAIFAYLPFLPICHFCVSAILAYLPFLRICHFCDSAIYLLFFNIFHFQNHILFLIFIFFCEFH